MALRNDHFLRNANWQEARPPMRRNTISAIGGIMIFAAIIIYIGYGLWSILP